jgi:MATE family multidrug resistance protein
MLAAGAPAGAGVWRAELAETIRLALPIALTQLGQIAMMTTDLALLGRLGEATVAAASLGNAVAFTCYFVGMGLMSAVAPLAAQAYGARMPRMVRRALRVGVWAAVMLGLPLMLVQLNGERLLLALGQAPETAALAGRYLMGLAWSMVPGWCYVALRGFMGAVNRPQPALWITLAAIPLNAVLAYGLIYGAFGLPRLDLLGAGIATTIVNICTCIAALWVAYALRPFHKYRVLGRFWRADWPLLGRLVAIGAPISGGFLLEYGLFAAAAPLMGLIGTTALAAHQIALMVSAILYMVPFGISIAATVRVGHAVGRRDAVATRRAGLAALALAAAFMTALTLAVVAARGVIPGLFLGSVTPDASAVVALAAGLLLVGATFFIADGMQAIAAGALRGLNDTRVPLLFSALSFWVVGFTAAYALAFPAGYGAYGVWIGLSLGTAVYAALLVARFHALTRRGYLPAVTGADESGSAALAHERVRQKR